MMARRPIYFVAKKELFINRPVAWLLSSLGAFPIDRGAGDQDAMDTATAILERGDVRPDLPRGHAHPARRARARPSAASAASRSRPARPSSRSPSSAPRPSARAGASARTRSASASAAPLTFPQVEQPSPPARRRRHRPHLAVRDAPVGVARRPAAAAPRRRHRRRLVGHRASRSCSPAPASRSTSACRTAEQAARRAGAAANDATCRRRAARERRVARSSSHARPRLPSPSPPRELPAAVAAHGAAHPRARRRARALQGPRRRRSARCPSAYVAERTQRARRRRCLGGPGARRRRARAAAPRSSSPAPTPAFPRQIADALRAAGFDVAAHAPTSSASSSPAPPRTPPSLAAAAAAPAGPNAAGAAAGKVFAEVDAYARRHGARPETFAGLAGAGDLVATVLADGSRNRRAGELLGRCCADRACATDGRRGARRVAGAGRRRRAAASTRRADGADGRAPVDAERHAATRPTARPPEDRLRDGVDPSVGQGATRREFSELYKAHLRDVYSYAYYRVGNHHDAEDLTEQTFLQAYRHFERAQRESRRPAAAAVADPHRPQPGGELLPRPLAQAADADRRRGHAVARRTRPRTLVEGRDDLARILEGVQELPDDRREALIMRFALGMDNREIARALGRTDGATKVLHPPRHPAARGDRRRPGEGRD